MIEKTGLVAVVLSLLHASAALAAQDMKNKDAICSLNADDQCEVKFNLANSGKAYYKVQQFDDIDGSWANIGDHNVPWKNGDTVESGNLYRVVGCDDMDGTQECLRSRVFWAPIILPAGDIPSRVKMSDSEGGEVWADISKNLGVAEQLRQLNVYRMSDIVSRSGGQISDAMTKPATHSHDPDFPHDENMIQHDVYQQYSELMTHFSNGHKITKSE